MENEPFAADLPRRFEADPGPPPDLAARALTLLAGPSPPRGPLSRRIAIGIAAIPVAAALVLAGRFALFGRRPLRVDLPTLQPSLFAHDVLFFGALAAFTIAVAVRPGRLGLGSGASWLRGAAFGSMVVVAAATLLWPLRSDAPEGIEAAAQLHPLGMPCLVLAALMASATLSALTWSLKGAVPVATRLRGAALGTASGVCAGLVLFLHCPGTATPHLLVGHVAPVLASMLIGALLTPRFLKP